MFNITSKQKKLFISSPVNARHVDGIKFIDTDIPSVHRYFAPTMLEPDELPSHTFATTGKTEIPQRSNTIVDKLRRPSLTLVRGLTKSNSRSASHSLSTHGRSKSEQTPDTKIAGTDSVTTPSKTFSSFVSSQPHNVRAQHHIAVRPKRKDSGTAINFDNVTAQDRPMGFKEIMEVQNFEQRMILYKKARDYWASADHGLMEWTENYHGTKVKAPSSVTHSNIPL